MTEDEALFTAALADPAERTPALALADWFDEHDEPELATALRESPALVTMLNEFSRWDTPPVQPLQEFRGGVWHPTLPALPAALLLTRYRHLFPVPPDVPERFDPDTPPPKQYSDPLDASAFVSRWHYQRIRQIADLRERAARRAAAWTGTGSPFGRAPGDLDAFEWRSCVLHEVVLRHGSLNRLPIANRHLSEMRKRRHPLAWLPVELSPLEVDLERYSVRFSGTGYGQPAVDSLPPTPGRTEIGGLKVTATAASVIEKQSPAFAAVRSWSPGSIGEWEAAEYHLDCKARAEYLGRDWFRSLALGDVFSSPQPRFSVSHIGAAGALVHLFSAAQSGGAYSRGDWGAYGRLHAWQSLGWLAGCDANADVDTVATVSEQCEWFTFGGTDWFHDIAWDLGLLCLRPDGMSLAALAATDTD